MFQIEYTGKEEQRKLRRKLSLADGNTDPDTHADPDRALEISGWNSWHPCRTWNRRGTA